MTGIKPKKIILVAHSPPAVENMSQEEHRRMLEHPNRKDAIQTVKGATKKRLKREKKHLLLNRNYVMM